ncbi:DUF4252 domain-containing protein [Granulicella mallensis]|uniref:DUF4252 domain-containing protein n=1 Tax=Granulicella mallensis (strain ATCC BAA-1857 / DSM 23137 / MP5ACTX8) TaxID=682795 RepID=G8NU60_GRAMM|nr:DUF4252 domain-containing protein [Granulicella mallensis]AEU38695.1 hypothetical protein AciX8_4422 [Granulicella mallensis MP5ACTX8]
MTKRLGLNLTLAAAMLAVLPMRAQVTIRVSSSGAEAPQVKDDLFAGTEKFAQGAKDVTEVNMDKSMLGMVPKGGGGMASRMDYIVIHSYTYDKPGMYRMEDIDVFRKKLTDGSWNCFIHTRDKDGSTDICSRAGEHGESNEMVIMTAEAKELTFIHLSGHMSMGDLVKMGGGMSGVPVPPIPPIPPVPHQ